jgi:hypothetical protein
MLTALNLPPYPFKLKEENDKVYLFDEIRKKYLFLTPEEWVRQHFIQFLIKEKKFPKGLIKIEGGLKLNSLARRSDILVHDQSGKPFLLVECKSTSIKITQKTFDQIARYNMIHKVKYLAVTNGLLHFFCEMDYLNSTYKFIEELPDYSQQ